MSSTVLPLQEEPTSLAALTDSALGQCWLNARDRLEALGMHGASGDRLHIYNNPIVRSGDKTPCTVVSYYRSLIDSARGTNNETAIHYQFMLAFHWAAGRTAAIQPERGQALANWEHALVAFSKRPRPFDLAINGAQCKECTVDVAEAFNQQAFMEGWLVKFLIVDYFVRLPYREGL